MLGWEFPPYLNGGLGVACAQLAKALAPLTELTLLVPRSEPGYHPPGMQLVGLNEVRLPPVREEQRLIEQVELRQLKLVYAEVNITAYESGTISHTITRTEEEVLQVPREVIVEHWAEQPRFVIDDLYGPDLYEKVTEYARICGQIAREEPFDVIHAHDWMTFLAGMELKAYTGKPLVLHVHSLEYDRVGPESQGWVYQIERHALEQADAVIAVSDYTREVIARHYGVEGKKVRAIPNGLAAVAPYRRKRPFPERLVTFVGRLTRQKGPDYLVDLLRALLAQDENLRFAIAGDGDALPAMMHAVARARLGDRVHFTGFLPGEEVRDLLSMSDVFVMPSVSEPFGLVAVEAAQMQVPCLLSVHSGVAQSLPHALTADPEDIGMMVQKIQGLLADEALSAAVVEGQNEDLKHLSWTGTATAIEGWYRELMPA